MRKILFVVGLFAVFVSNSAFAKGFELKSTDVKNGGTLKIEQVYNGFGCEGKNISPELSFHNVPKDAKSLALTVYDPDALTGSGWWHWVVFNIPVDTKGLSAGASGTGMPKGAIESITDYGTTGFGGACPPAGVKPHRYIFTLWALNTEKLDLDEKASGAKVGFFLNSHKIATAKIEAKFGRK